MQIIPETLSQLPLLRLTIIGEGKFELDMGIKLMLDLAEMAQNQYQAIPNEHYEPKKRKDNNANKSVIQMELIFKNPQDARMFAFGLEGSL